MSSSAKAWAYALGGVGIYVSMIILTAVLLGSNDVDRPVLRALFWPISLTRLLLGGF